MLTVKEMSRRTGVSVRTLHHYDAIGLLRPSAVTESGYRLYDGDAMARLHSILLFRELRFSLKEIRTILDSPDFDRAAALAQQIELLELEYKRLGTLLHRARAMKKGETDMDFEMFDQNELEQYREEAKARWGSTEQWKQQEEKAASGADMGAAGAALMGKFAELGRLADQDAASPAVQAWVKELQQFITDNFYTCTKEILAGLGQMYTCDERFAKNIDQAGGAGTAQLAADAIAIYCKQ